MQLLMCIQILFLEFNVLVNLYTAADGNDNMSEEFFLFLFFPRL